MRRLSPRSAASRGGFTLIEMLASLGIMTGVFAGIFLLMGQSSRLFYGTGAMLELRNTLRLAGEKVAGEVRYTGYDPDGTAHFMLFDGTGVNGSDVIRFSIPVLCSASSVLVNEQGDPAHWGAPLTWGCSTSSCMDQDNSCATVEYKYVQYQIDGEQRLVREVLSPLMFVAASQVVAGDIVDFQLRVSGNILAFSVSAQKNTEARTSESAVYEREVFFNNYGGSS